MNKKLVKKKIQDINETAFRIVQESTNDDNPRREIGFKFVTPNDIAEGCGVSKVTVLRWIEQGHLKSIKLPSGHNRILIEEFERFKKTIGM